MSVKYFPSSAIFDIFSLNPLGPVFTSLGMQYLDLAVVAYISILSFATLSVSMKSKSAKSNSAELGHFFTQTAYV